MKTNVIETQGLTRRYGRQEAVNELTLAVPAGSVFALLGPNGAGKSTTLKMLMNLVRPTAGVARVFGKDSRELGVAEKQRIGYVAEGQELPDWMTVREFLDFCRPLYPTWDAELERTLLAKFELPESRKLKALSRGMRMKAALLSVLAFRPELLLLDEPFSGLDPAVRDDFIRGLLEVSALGQWTVVLSSHDIEEVERLADHIALIDGGRLRLSESLESLQTRLRRVEVTLPNGAAEGAGEWPATWWEREQSGALLRFVETAYAPGGDCEARYKSRFPGAEVAVRPVPLREAYLLHARGGNGADRDAWWFLRPELERGERVLLSHAANHTQNGWRAVGGKLYVTDRRLVFLPNQVDDRAGGKRFEASLRDVRSCFVAERKLSWRELFSGAFRRRLGVRLADGSEEFFVVLNAFEAAAGIEAAIKQEGRS